MLDLFVGKLCRKKDTTAGNDGTHYPTVVLLKFCSFIYLNDPEFQGKTAFDFY